MRKNKYMRHRAGIRKCLAIGLTEAMCMAMLAGCSTSQSTSSTSGTEVTSDVSTETDADKESQKGSADAENTSVKTEMTVEEMQAVIDEAMSDADIDITDMFTKRDLSGSYDESEAVKITLSGKTAACNSSNVQIEDGVVTIKAAGVYVLSGTLTDGTYTIDSKDHCLNGKDSVRIADGTFNLSCDEDGIHAGNDDQQDASKSYEGVEGYKILVTGGDIDVVSSDDGFNAAGGSSSGSDDNKGGFGGGPVMGGVDMDADSDAYILITGGTLNINADGDGLDSNGCIGITGGSVCVLGPSDNGNGAMDYGICAAITGGEVVAVGGSGMAQGFGDESTQCSALVNFDEWVDAGETITLTDSDGKEVLSYKVDKKFNSVVISTSDMKQGDTCTLTVGDQSSTFTLDDITYSEGSGGMQRPGGNSDEGNMQRPDGDSDNGQNDSTNGSLQNKDNSSSSDSMSI